MMRQHGLFSMAWNGPILVVRYLDTWNMEAVLALHQAAQSAWTARTFPQWAMLSDLSHWDGATPETLERWWVFFDDCVAQGLTTVTDIFSSQFHGLLVESVAQRASALVNYRRSDNRTEAFSWLAAQGFAADARQ
ncbi:hypothetical protein RQP54_08210 [Curvibacter sp. APW13]|uniref:hypothetical protein n=1 Tax=Curvibacter sp. APW13 TaxID=3077236 RepID=UPI0028DDD2EA|nr:hypothetical protein [Curvibacter sp. APW13]MDT8990849.1 hypothetical protein [Curvibacter sp. APW13]